jgi:hypothetical protein
VFERDLGHVDCALMVRDHVSAEIDVGVTREGHTHVLHHRAVPGFELAGGRRIVRGRGRHLGHHPSHRGRVGGLRRARHVRDCGPTGRPRGRTPAMSAAAASVFRMRMDRSFLVVRRRRPAALS